LQRRSPGVQSSLNRSDPLKDAAASTAADESAGEPENLRLVAMMKSDPGNAVELLYARFSNDVNRLVWRLLGADPDHSDIVQQVFFKVMRHGHRLREPKKLRAWVQSITVNTVYEELRKRDVRRLFVRQWPVGVHPDLVHDVEARDIVLRVRSLIERLPAKERVVFVLHFVEERTLNEVAELCGYSVATAKRRLKAANRRFESLLTKNPDLARLLTERESKP
jgi:RNA polymerase sigma-70 factor (ECF subfamily)